MLALAYLEDVWLQHTAAVRVGQLRRRASSGQGSAGTAVSSQKLDALLLASEPSAQDDDDYMQRLVEAIPSSHKVFCHFFSLSLLPSSACWIVMDETGK
jgi:hypothetical protein